MLERTEIGKQVRQYFITIEKKAKQAMLAMAYQTNRFQSTLLPTIEQEAAGCLAGWMQAASILEIPVHVAQIEAVKATQARTGIDYSPLLLAAPTQDDIKEEDVMLEPSEIATCLGIDGSVQERGNKINKFLEYIGCASLRPMSHDSQRDVHFPNLGNEQSLVLQ